MTKQQFLNLCKTAFVILDGATGSNLQKKGMPVSICPEQWILENPNVLQELQEEYVNAGTTILYAPTFTANRVKLQEYGLYDKMQEMIHKLVQISKNASKGKAFVAGDITMTGKQLIPMGDMEFEMLVDIYKEQIGYLVEAGVDLLVVETMMSLQETRAAVIAAKEVCELPIMTTLTFEADGRTLFGTDAKTAAVVLDSLGVDAIGANCSTGPEQMAEIIREMAKVTDKPLIGKPNAGLPEADAAGNTFYNMDETTFALDMKLLIDAGTSIVGGCCGTTPAYIKKVSESLKTYSVDSIFSNRAKAYVENAEKYVLTSERKTVHFGLNDSFMIVGERINPTGKKSFQEALRSNDMQLVRDFTEQQENDGASILDVNVGMSGIDEKEMMLKVLQEVTLSTSLPLAIDSSHPEVLEAALRAYPGRALVNSVSLENIKIEKVLPLVKKYGAMFILLPLSDDGLPENIAVKIDIINKIIAKANEIGLTKKDIVVDGLVATVGAQKTAAIDTLLTIDYCKKEGLATICGLSNISFGLPERSHVNTAFLTMAIQNGLTMAIANPSQELLMCGAFASDLLLAKENSDIKYIEYTSLLAQRHQNDVKTVQSTSKTSVKASARSERKMNSEEEQILYHDVLKGNRSSIVEHVKNCMGKSISPQNILNNVLMIGINDVGDLFDKGIYFLPQLISSAEAMKTAIDYLEPYLQDQNDENHGVKPIIVMATVEGDIHDIGKNLVVMMLKNHGFDVIDLGKDVPKDLILDTAINKGAKIIGLSALMTTTMQEMRHVIALAKQRNYTGKIMIGGAVITQEYADEIGADGYSKDAADAVKLAERLLDEM